MTDSGKFVSKKVKSIPPSGIRRFFDLAVGIPGVISLGVGEPDFVTPWHVREACSYSLEQGYTMYTSNAGLLELREELQKSILNEYGLNYDPISQIIITVGASEAVDLAIRAVVEPGDEIIICEPSYVSYKPCVSLAGGIPVPIKTEGQYEFKLQADQLEESITSKTKAIIMSYPNNPTGGIMTKTDLEDIKRVIIKHDLLVISDEIYSKLTYGQVHTSIASLPEMQERTVVINGFSKAQAMTGWRIGYSFGPEAIISAMVKIHQYTILCAPIMAQKAACESLRNGKEEITRMYEEYDKRRRFVFNSFIEMGLDCFEPMGAFYIFPNINKTGLNSEEFAQELLKEEKVAVVPGNAFGLGGEGHIRCSYAASFNKLVEALTRIERFINKRI
ncbi:MAG: aminotransferase class I/II-fold pyridoxal phosphate-dependent enzyme [Bacillota bacterium]